MVRQGLLGTLTHAEGAYLHDLRDTLNAQDGHGTTSLKRSGAGPGTPGGTAI